MMTKTNLLTRILILAVLFAFSGCGSGSEKKTDENASKEFSEAEKELKDKIESVIKKMPPPSQIPFKIEATGADYNESLINSLDKADSYMLTNYKSALNLGVYASDIGYLSSYNKTQEALNYLNASKGIADHMGITGAFDVALLKRFENNLGSRDSLADIINESIGKADQYLRDEDRTKVAVMVLAGSFIEGLYISTKLVETYPKDILPEDARNLILSDVIRTVLEQKDPLGDLIVMLKGLGEDSEAAGLITGLEELKGNFDELNIEEKIKENRGDLVLTDQTLTTITAKVNEIRSGIVE